MSFRYWIVVTVCRLINRPSLAVCRIIGHPTKGTPIPEGGTRHVCPCGEWDYPETGQK